MRAISFHVALAAIAAVTGGFSLACAQMPRFGSVTLGPEETAPPPFEPSAADRARAARHSLQTARALVAEGKLEFAASSLRRGLRFQPDDPALLRALARVLDAQGHPEDAARRRERADAIEPPPPPPPNTPLDVPSRGVLAVLVPPERRVARVPADWPNGVVAETLMRRLRIRLPEAQLALGEVASVAAGKRWLAEVAPRAVLSLRVDRSFCGDSIKDGRFAVAWLRIAAAGSDTTDADPFVHREVVTEPRLPIGCRREAVARALEAALASPSVRAILQAPRPRKSNPSRDLSRLAVRQLFPDLDRRIEEHLDIGRARLAAGDITAAAAAFAAAARIDPNDPDVRAYADEAAATLALLSQLAPDVAPALEPRLSSSQRARAEARLVEERRRRDVLLATLAVLEEDLKAPSEDALAALSPADVVEAGDDAHGFGPTLARERTGGAIASRVVYAPDGSAIARYYIPAGGGRPVLREEDTSGDGRPDRWITYDDGTRDEIFEDVYETGRPDLRFVFAPGGERLDRIELDRDANGRPERVFVYADGALDSEHRDTTGDGTFDRYERFDDDGNVALREEDLDGDGVVDVRTIFEHGRLVRRELSDLTDTPDDT
jgi:tetratricopeptide (TPR) repeat protein